MEKRAWRFTFRDAVILLIILIAAFLFILKLGVARELDQPDTDFEIVLRGEGRYPFMQDQIQVGDKVYQKGSPVVFGVVTSVTNEPARSDIIDILSGQIKPDELVPNSYNIVVKIKSRGFSSLSGSAIIDNNLITVNQYLVINTNRVFLPTRVMSIVNEG